MSATKTDLQVRWRGEPIPPAFLALIEEHERNGPWWEPDLDGVRDAVDDLRRRRDRVITKLRRSAPELVDALDRIDAAIAILGPFRVSPYPKAEEPQ